MTVYRLPDEPDVDTIWVPESREDSVTGPGWTGIYHRKRDEDGQPIGWTMTGSDYLLSWREILRFDRPIYDTHPDLDGVPPLPWSLDAQAGHVLDAAGRFVPLDYEDAVQAFIVRAVNELAEQNAREWGAR